MGISLYASYNRSNLYTGTAFTSNDNYYGRCRVSLGKVVTRKYELQAAPELGYTLTRSSLNAVKPHYWTQRYSLLAEWYLPFGIEWDTNLTYTILQRTSFAGDNRLFVWDSYISRYLFQGSIALKLQGKDLLGQNSGISRSNTGNQVAESISNNVTGRYILFSVTYHWVHKTP
jgi:hypothetical protein